MNKPRYKSNTNARFVGTLGQADLYFYDDVDAGLAVTPTATRMLLPRNCEPALDVLYAEAKYLHEITALPLIIVHEGIRHAV